MKFRGLMKTLPVLLVCLGLLTACGKEKYVDQNFQSSATANQYVTSKPKVDIVVFQDDSDSVMYGPISALKPQMQNFLSQLSSDWDIHFVVLPLLSDQSSLSGKYVVASDCSSISGASGCYPLSQTSTYNSQPGDAAWLNNSNSGVGSLDQGLYYMQRNLSRSSFTSSGFLRSDAALAVIVVSNGQDLSGINPNNKGSCYDGYGNYNPSAFPQIDYCNANGSGTYEVNTYANSLSSSYNSFANYFAQVRGSSLLAKFYSIVSPSTTSGCYGSYAMAGTRYISMSQQFNSSTGNLCNSSGFSTVLNDIRSNLHAVTTAIKFNYAVVSTQYEPLVSSITVQKNGVTIPQSDTNGWSYVGYLSNQPTSYYPTSGNVQSGYMIQLNGSAVYQGSDSLSINYTRK
jgi:hypothetical protein